jgi:hypothetical protein
MIPGEESCSSCSSRAARCLLLASAHHTSPESDGVTFDHGFEAILLRLREVGQEPGHAQVALLSEPCKFRRCRFENRAGAFHGEMQRLNGIDAEHVPWPPPVRLQTCDLERAAPVPAGNGLWHSNREDHRPSAGRLEHTSCRNPPDRSRRRGSFRGRHQNPLA